MDANGVLTDVLLEPGSLINVEVVTGPATPAGSLPVHTLDANGVWNQVYDRATNTLRIVMVD